MTPSIDCQNLIKISEGLKLEAYRDTGGIWTIGWGHTGPEVHKDLQWKQAQADIALYSDVMHAWEEIREHVEPCTQGQCDAMTPTSRSTLAPGPSWGRRCSSCTRPASTRRPARNS